MSVLFALPLYAAFQSAATPPRIKAAAAVILIATAVRPLWGLMILAAFAPLGTYVFVFAGGLDSPLSIPSVVEILILPFLLAASLRLLFTLDGPRSVLARPATVLAWVIAVAGTLGLVAQQQATAWPTVFLGALWRHVTDGYFADANAFIPLHIATQWLEALALAERLGRGP